MISPDMCSCCNDIWNRQNLKKIPLGKHELCLCPDCYAEYIKPFNEIREEIKQYNRKPSHAPIDMIEIATVLQIIDKYKTKSKDIEMQATDFLAEARTCAER